MKLSAGLSLPGDLFNIKNIVNSDANQTLSSIRDSYCELEVASIVHFSSHMFFTRSAVCELGMKKNDHLYRYCACGGKCKFLQYHPVFFPSWMRTLYEYIHMDALASIHLRTISSCYNRSLIPFASFVSNSIWFEAFSAIQRKWSCSFLLVWLSVF